MSTAVSVRLPDRAVESLDDLAARAQKRRGAVIADALIAFRLLMAETTMGQAHLPAITDLLRKEYNRGS